MVRRKLAVGVFGRKKAESFAPKIDGRQIDLNEYRQHFASAGQTLNCCDIIGAGWGNLALEDSGFKGPNEGSRWWLRKLELMRGYRFNLAFENTNWPYYVTEKIWQAIRATCLPVYWGKDNSIYESFEPDSFVDASQFESPKALWEYLRKMTYAEWVVRYQRCVTAYNKEMSINIQTGFPRFSETVQRVYDVLKASRK